VLIPELGSVVESMRDSLRGWKREDGNNSC